MKFKKEISEEKYNNDVYYKKILWTSKRYSDESVDDLIVSDQMTWDDVRVFIENKTGDVILNEMSRTKRQTPESRNFLVGFVSVVMFYRSEADGYRLVKSIFRSPVHYVRSMEISKKIEELVHVNVEGSRHVSHIDSGFVLYNLSQFQAQIIGGMSTDRFVLLRNSIIGARDTLFYKRKKYDHRNKAFFLFKMIKMQLRKIS